MWCRESLLSTVGGNSKCLYSCMRLLTTGCSVCKSKFKFSWLIISNSENCKTSYSHCGLRATSPEYIQIPEMQLQALLPSPALLPECPQRACWQATVTVETSTCKETTKNNCLTKNNSGMLLGEKLIRHEIQCCSKVCWQSFMSPSSRLKTGFLILEFKPWYRVYFFCPLKLFRHCPQINNEVISENR